MSWLMLIPLALAVGVVLGALGGGGAILAVPILVYLVGQPTTSAQAGALLVVVLGAIGGLVTHARGGTVRWRDGLIFGACGVLGTILGSTLSTALSEPQLLTAFGVLLIVVAGLMIRKALRHNRSGAQAGTRRGPVALVAAATGTGLLTGFFSVGGGFAVVPALVLVMGFAAKEAVGTSLLVMIINSAVALGTRLVHGVPVDWPVIIAFGVLSALGSLLGARIAQRVPGHYLSGAFAVMLLIIAIYTLIHNVPLLVR